MRGSKFNLVSALILGAVAVMIPVSAYGQANTVANWQTGTTSTGAPINNPVSNSNPLPVTISGGSGGTVTANQGTPNAGGASNSWFIQGAGTAGVPAGGVVSIQGVSGGTSIPVSTGPSSRTLVTLDVKTVTTGGTAVTAIAVGHRTAGGLLCNPLGATINLGINEIGTASGTTSSGDTTFIAPGQCYNVAPAAGAVSVISSDSSHPFSGYGMN